MLCNYFVLLSTPLLLQLEPTRVVDHAAEPRSRSTLDRFLPRVLTFNKYVDRYRCRSIEQIIRCTVYDHPPPHNEPPSRLTFTV